MTVYGKPDRVISRVAVCPGSGKSFLSSAVDSGADVYVTGDVDYISESMQMPGELR